MNLRDPVKHMIRMENALDYILDHLKEKINIEDVASQNNYNPVHFARLFLEYFEYPFARYVVMLRLRKCTRTILESRSLKDVGSTYGYATAASFSKAFRNEFGISPREFLKKGYLPPDMPERKCLNKVPIELSYTNLSVFSMGGYPVSLDRYVKTEDQMEQVYPLLPEDGDQEKEPWPRFGVWYCDEDKDISYLYGPELLKGERKKKDMRRIRFREGDYAVFSFERMENDEDTIQFTRLLHQYIFREWTLINQKVPDSRNCTFARFDKEKVALYVPILKGMYGQETISEINWKIAGWCRYIDEHIMEDLTVKDLAEKWYYSEVNFRLIFTMYYGMDPGEYIRRKRLYLAASALHKGEKAEKIIKEYHFDSPEDFERQFLTEFGTSTSDIRSLDVEPVDLIEYYQHYKKSIHLKFRHLLPQKAAVKLLDRDKEMVRDAIRTTTEDIPETAAYWFTHDFDCLKGTEYEIDEKERPSRVFIWKNEPVIVDGEAFYDYYLGPMIKKEAGTPEGMTEILIPGGNYAVFRTENRSDLEDLAETYRMLTRVCFGGWINECRFRVDYSRPTFINYKRQKLFFYVPVIL